MSKGMQGWIEHNRKELDFRASVDVSSDALAAVVFRVRDRLARIEDEIADLQAEQDGLRIALSSVWQRYKQCETH